jgi:hypothetical protein
LIPVFILPLLNLLTPYSKIDDHNVIFFSNTFWIRDIVGRISVGNFNRNVDENNNGNKVVVIGEVDVDVDVDVGDNDVRCVNNDFKCTVEFGSSRNACYNKHFT